MTGRDMDLTLDSTISAPNYKKNLNDLSRVKGMTNLDNTRGSFALLISPNSRFYQRYMRHAGNEIGWWGCCDDCVFHNG